MKPVPLLVLFVAAGLASGQDMPLHEILKPGETWQPHAGPMPAAGQSPKTPKPGPEVKEPTCAVVALGGSTLLVADASDGYVWAFRLEKDGALGPGDRYIRLRVREDERRTRVTPREQFRADPSAMTVDAADRTYVATNLGIQVFDPTGRLCGVFTAPPGRVTELAFDGDRLLARAGDKVYVRQVFANGTK